jgi:hypothetical protein
LERKEEEKKNNIIPQPSQKIQEPQEKFINFSNLNFSVQITESP